MSESKAAPGFPYDHLAVLGFDKLKRYVPPMPPEGAPRVRPPPDEDEQTTPAPPSEPANGTGD